MERRLLIAFILMAAVLFLTPYFFRSSGPAPAPAKPKPAPAADVTPEKPKAAALPAEAIPPAAGQVAGASEETFVADTNLFRVVLSNRGAVVRSWVLKRYKDNAGNQLELVNGGGAAKAGYPLSLEFRNGKPDADLTQVLYAARPHPDGLGVDYEYSDGRAVSRKSFRFRKDSYITDVSSEVTSGGKRLAHVLAWRGGFGDRSVANHAATQHSVYFDVAANKLVVNDAKAAEDGPVSSTGQYSFAGIEDSYFAAVFLPSDGAQIELRTYHDLLPESQGGKDVPHAGAGVGGSRNRFAMFVGPKDIDTLRKVNPKLEQLVDFGWFALLAKPLFLALNWVNDRYVQNYGWSIVVVTVIINFLLLPLKFTSLKSMKKMQALAPQIAAINERYKNVGLRDPRKAEQNQEVMELYKKHGVNPMGSCIPMLLQIPFFIAFYKVLTVAIEMRGASWLWVTDLSQPEHIPIRILPIAMIISQFIMQKMTPATTADPAQQKVMLFMPLILGFMFYGVSSGLVLYWLTGNLVGIAQQWFFNKTSIVPASAITTVQAPAKRAKRSRK
jgi:YidC/Oxa1 family membrane protein insertase